MIDADTHTFCEMVRNRSEENRRAIRCFSSPHGVLSPAISILRQELDSMVRIIYLLSVKDPDERSRLIRSTMQGEKWKVRTEEGGLRNVRDRDMVNLAQHLQGWTQSVYSFGCAFVHLSDFHNHLVQNPFQSLASSEKQNLLRHMRHYHGGPLHDDPDMVELSAYVPSVFDKIADNLKCYLDQLERGDIAE